MTYMHININFHNTVCLAMNEELSMRYFGLEFIVGWTKLRSVARDYNIFKIKEEFSLHSQCMQAYKMQAIAIRECGSTLYVGMIEQEPLTSTNLNLK